VAEELVRRGVGVRWAAIFRPQRARRADLELLKRSGLYAMELGTDASTDATLAGLGKGFTFGEVLAFNEAAVAAEIPAAHFVMFGGPGETAATVREGLENLRRLDRSVIFAYSASDPARHGLHPGLSARASRPEPCCARLPTSPSCGPEAMNAQIERPSAAPERIFRPRRDGSA
jgi:hypothetical protein